MTDAEENAHARLSPSAAKRWMSCPASVILSDGVPSHSSPYAQEGTLAHAFAERWIVSGDKPEGMPEGMAEHVAVYVDYANRDGYEGRLVEQRVHLSEHTYGTGDLIRFEQPDEGPTLEIVDLKYGVGIPVEIEGNTQLRIYAAAALRTFPDFKPRYIRTTIVQPRCEHPDGSIRSTTYTVSEIVDFSMDVLAAEERVLEAEEAFEATGKTPDGFYGPSPEACRFCPGAVKCTKVRDMAQAAARLVFTPEAYDPGQLSEALSVIPIFSAWAKQIESFAFNELAGGKPVPHYKLVAKQARAKWRDGLTPEYLASQLGVDARDVAEVTIKSITEVKKWAPGKNDKERGAALLPYTIKESSGVTLVHESDSRPAAQVDAKSVFEAVAED